MSSPNPDDTTELRRLLAQARPKAHYDVEAGAQRHRQLVARGAPPPDWASAALHVRRVPSAWMWSVLGGALLLGVWALQTSPSASSEAARVARITAPTVSSASDVRPTIEPLVVQAVPPPVAPQPAAHQPAVAAAALQVAEATPARVARPAPASTLQTSSADKAARTLRTPRARVVTAGTVATSSAGADAPLELDLSARAQAPTDDPASLQNTTPEQPVRSPAPDAIDPEVLEEMQQLATAERLLPTMPSRTLALVREGMQRFQRGYLAQERRYLEIMALLALKMPKDAELLSRSFLRDYPKGPYRRKVERALEDGARD